MAESDVVNLITSFLNAYSANTQSRDQKAVKNAINGIKRELKKQEKRNKKTQFVVVALSIIGSSGLTLIVEHVVLKIPEIL